MTRRSMIFVAAGALTVLLGVAVLLLNRGGTSEAAVAQTVTDDGVKVLVAKEALAADTDANEAFRTGRIEVRTVPVDDRAADALTSATELDGRSFVVEVPAGAQIGAGTLSRIPLRTQAIKVPDGTQGLAIEVPFAAGGAGYIAPGDKVDVMAMLEADATAEPDREVAGKSTVAVLRNVEVLDVSTELAPRVATGRVTTTTTTASGGAAAPAPAPSQLTYLLAIPEAEVERMVQAAGYHRLYLALTSGDGATERPEPSSVDDGDLRGKAA